MATELSDYLTADAQQVVEKVLQKCSPQQVTMDCRGFNGVSSVVVREALLQVWKRVGWPRNGMTRSHWLQLETMVMAESDVTIFPGSIRAEKNGEQLSLTRR